VISQALQNIDVFACLEMDFSALQKEHRPLFDFMTGRCAVQVSKEFELTVFGANSADIYSQNCTRKSWCEIFCLSRIERSIINVLLFACQISEKTFLSGIFSVVCVQSTFLI
jgi:hypothetical protein